MSVKPIYVIALLVAAIAGTLTQALQVRELNHALQEAQEGARLAAGDARVAHAVAELALEEHRRVGVEAARLAEERDDALDAYRAARRGIARLPATAPDTCLPWVLRAATLDTALAKADGVIVQDALVIKALERDTTTLAHGLRGSSAALLSAQQALERLAKRIPTAIPTRSTRLGAAADVRVTSGGPVVGSLLAVSGPVYGGVELEARDGAVHQRAVLGIRKALRIF